MPERKHDSVIAEVIEVMSRDPAVSYGAAELVDALEAKGRDWFGQNRQPHRVRAQRLGKTLWKEGRAARPRVVAADRGRYRLPWPLTVTVSLDEDTLRAMLHPGGPVVLPNAYGGAVQVEAFLALGRGAALRVLIDAIYDLTHGDAQC